MNQCQLRITAAQYRIFTNADFRNHNKLKSYKTRDNLNFIKIVDVNQVVLIFGVVNGSSFESKERAKLRKGALKTLRFDVYARQIQSDRTLRMFCIRRDYNAIIDF